MRIYERRGIEVRILNGLGDGVAHWEKAGAERARTTGDTSESDYCQGNIYWNIYWSAIRTNAVDRRKSFERRQLRGDCKHCKDGHPRAATLDSCAKLYIVPPNRISPEAIRLTVQLVSFPICNSAPIAVLRSGYQGLLSVKFFEKGKV